jgi:hypothetical protein
MKAASAVVIVSILILAFGVQSLVVANPRPIQLPITPDKNETSVTISLPKNNQTYNANTIHYALKVAKPSSWFDYLPVHGEVMFASYLIDQNANEKQIAEVTDLYSKQPLNYEGDLTNLSEGNHSFQIKVRSCSYYNHFYDSNNSNTWSGIEYYYINNYSQMINFTVNIGASTIFPSQTIMPLPSASLTLAPTQVNSSVSTNKEANLNLFDLAPIVLVIFLILAFAALVVNRRRHPRTLETTGTVMVLYEAFVCKLISYDELVEDFAKLAKVMWISTDVTTEIISKAKKVKK